jgi:hypothetical protein
MAEEAADGRQTYLVEHFRPGVPADGLRSDASRLRGAAEEMEREGKSVRHVRSTIVPGDEFFLCIFDAASEELVREAYARAGITFQRISAALGDED